MAKTAKPKTSKGTQNDQRPNRKAWKKGLHPEVREAQAKVKREAKRAAQS